MYIVKQNYAHIFYWSLFFFCFSSIFHYLDYINLIYMCVCVCVCVYSLCMYVRECVKQKSMRMRIYKSMRMRIYKSM